jgi:hypothetical protein
MIRSYCVIEYKFFTSFAHKNYLNIKYSAIIGNFANLVNIYYYFFNLAFKIRHLS